MRRRKRSILVLFLIIATGITVAGLQTGMYEQENAAAVITKEDPTPVVAGVMTDRQRRHSKLYEKHDRGTRKFHNVTQSVGIMIPPPFIEAPHDRLPQSTDQFFRVAACTADLVVVGVVKNKTSQLTENGSFVFTDYEMVID